MVLTSASVWYSKRVTQMARTSSAGAAAAGDPNAAAGSTRPAARNGRSFILIPLSCFALSGRIIGRKTKKTQHKDTKAQNGRAASTTYGNFDLPFRQSLK